MAAVRTEKIGMESPAIEKKEGLLSVGQGLPDRLDEGAGDKRCQPPLVTLRPEIDHLDPGEGSVVDPGGEGQVAVTAFGGMKIALDGRRGDPRITVACKNLPLTRARSRAP